MAADAEDIQMSDMVRTNEVLQRVRTEVGDVDGRRAARMNVASGNGGRCGEYRNVG